MPLYTQAIFFFLSDVNQPYSVKNVKVSNSMSCFLKAQFNRSQQVFQKRIHICRQVDHDAAIVRVSGTVRHEKIAILEAREERYY